MPTKEEEFKQRFAALLEDLQTDARHDAEAVWLIGSLAAAFIDRAGARSWPALKQALSAHDYNGALEELKVQGNAFYRDGRHKHAYAAQALGMSLVARTQLDAAMQEGNTLLDNFIEQAVSVYRRSRRPQAVG